MMIKRNKTFHKITAKRAFCAAAIALLVSFIHFHTEYSSLLRGLSYESSFSSSFGLFGLHHGESGVNSSSSSASATVVHSKGKVVRPISPLPTAARAATTKLRTSPIAPSKDDSTPRLREQDNPRTTTVKSTTTSVSTTAPHSLKSDPDNWVNEYNVVHVLLTRFFQHQPNFVHLGQARLQLFQTFCLPTIRQQTTQQFLWMIRVDPDLKHELKDELLQILQHEAQLYNFTNVLVIGSNARIDQGHFRTVEAIADVNETSLWYGSMQLLQSYHEASQTRVVLETVLDADDGLALSYLQDLQRYTSKIPTLDTSASSKMSTNTTTTQDDGPKYYSWWRLFCISSSYEWQYYGPYWNSSHGAVAVSPRTNQWCLTPGLTRATTQDYRRYGPSLKEIVYGAAQESDLLKDAIGFLVHHYFINRKLQRCRPFGVHPIDTPGTKLVLLGNQKGCFRFLSSNYTQAIRARTPTSAGMLDVLSAASLTTTTTSTDTNHTNTTNTNSTNTTTAVAVIPIDRDIDPHELQLWHEVITTFGMNLTTVALSRQRMQDNLDNILHDALLGALGCSGGHICKPEAKDMLLALMNQSGKNNYTELLLNQTQMLHQERSINQTRIDIEINQTQGTIKN